MTTLHIERPYTSGGKKILDPPFAKFLFSDVRMAWVWLALRLWLGYTWLMAGIHKFSNPAWMENGFAVKGYWTRAIQIPEQGRPAISFDWYRDFLTFLLESESYGWFAKLVVYGEILVGVALIIGAFVGVAATMGAFMNWNFIMAGSASSNGLLLVAAVILILAWKTAGYFGADYVLLKKLGVPWKLDSTKSTNSPT